MTLDRRLIAEGFGTCWLVLGGCGAAIFAGDKIGFEGVSLAFGLTVMTMAYAVGHISGCHLNPAVTVGLVAAKKFDAKDAPLYIAAQVAGALAGALLIFAILKLGVDDFSVDQTNGFAANGVGAPAAKGHPAFLNVGGAFLVEMLLTFFFLFVILGSTHERAPAGFAPIAIGLCLTLIHLISIPLTNTSVNPARSTSQALFAGGDYLKELLLFWLAPVVGGALAGLVYPTIAEKK